MNRIAKRVARGRLGRTLLRLEDLEARVLLSASGGLEDHPAAAVPYVNLSAPGRVALGTTFNVDAFGNLTDVVSKGGFAPAGMPAELQSRVDDRVWTALQNPAAGTLEVKPGAARVDATGHVQVYIRVPGLNDQVVGQIEQLGVKIDTANAQEGVVQAWISAADLDGVLAISGVQSIRLPQYLLARVTSAGDAIHQADIVRSSIPGLDGTGVKVGVISFGLDDTAAVGAELPAITVDPLHDSVAGEGNEGTAMLEIVHDVAPGAALYFSGPDTSLEMIDSIDYMVNTAGVDVIVDDLGFLDQHMFDDGSIAQAAEAATAAGVVYVTAAGNDGFLSHYQAPYNQRSATSTYHNFANAAYPNPNIGNFMEMDTGANFVSVLQWSDEFGSSANDYDYYLALFNPADSTATIVAVSEDVQDGTPGSDPLEFLTYTTIEPNGSTFLVAIHKFAGDARELEFYIVSGPTALDGRYYVPGDSIFGASAGDGIVTVGAADSTDTSIGEIYSSQGPSTKYTDFPTQTKILTDSLDGMSVDNVETAVGQASLFFNPFFGTSAAAPHVAGIAALMLQANPALTPAQIVDVLRGTATDLLPAGYDDATGAGLFDAYGAVLAVVTPAAPSLTAATDSGLSNTDGVTNNASPVVTGTAPAGAYVRLFMDGLEVASTQLGAAETTYTIPLAGLGDGSSELRVNVAPSVFTPLAYQSARSAPFTMTIDTVAPDAPNAPDLDNAASDPDGDNVTTDATPVFNVSGTGSEYWSIYRDGAEVSGPPLAGDDGKVYKGPGDGSEELPAQVGGTATFTVRARDAAGNESADSAGLSVTIDVGTPSLVVTNTLDSGPGSLRAAVIGANAAAGADTIIFDIPTASPQIIELASALPNLNDSATLQIDPADAVEVGTFAGGFTFGDYPGLTLDGGGTLTIDGTPAHSAAATIAVAAGNLKLGSSEHFAAVTVGAGTTLEMLAAGSNVLETESLAVDPTGILDLVDNDLVVHATAGTRAAVYATVNALVSSGFASFTWIGLGINSSAAAADASFLTALGVMLNDDGLGGAFHPSFSGVPVDANAILVKYTYYGDADLSGAVDGTDYALIDNGFNAALTGWFNGDFDYTTVVDGTDYALIDNSFNSQGGPLSGTVAPPPVAVDPVAGLPPQQATPPFALPADFDPAGIDDGLLDLLTAPAGGKRRRF